jgi:CheY-like chemotaxis protein
VAVDSPTALPIQNANRWDVDFPCRGEGGGYIHRWLNAELLYMNTLVLYAEDEPDDVLFMRRAFKQEGLADSLRAVGDGRDAIDYLAGKGVYADRGQHPLPALILLDLNLPVVSGFEVLKWLSGRPELKELAAVVFSSSEREDDKVRARDLGAREFIQKPSSTEGLKVVVQKL